MVNNLSLDGGLVYSTVVDMHACISDMPCTKWATPLGSPSVFEVFLVARGTSLLQVMQCSTCLLLPWSSCFELVLIAKESGPYYCMLHNLSIIGQCYHGLFVCTALLCMGAFLQGWRALKALKSARGHLLCSFFVLPHAC